MPSFSIRQLAEYIFPNASPSLKGQIAFSIIPPNPAINFAIQIKSQVQTIVDSGRINFVVFPQTADSAVTDQSVRKHLLYNLRIK